jgi:hypothetical protein
MFRIAAHWQCTVSRKKTFLRTEVKMSGVWLRRGVEFFVLAAALLLLITPNVGY